MFKRTNILETRRSVIAKWSLAAVGLALLIGAAVVRDAQSQTTTLDQVPIPIPGTGNTTGQSELLMQSVPVTGGTVDVSILRQPGAGGAIIGISQSFRAASTLVNYTKTVTNSGSTAANSIGYLDYVGQYVTEVLIEPTTTQPYTYQYLTAQAVDGERWCLFSTATITQVNIATAATQTINNAITTLAANTRACYTYSLANTTWDRSQ